MRYLTLMLAALLLGGPARAQTEAPAPAPATKPTTTAAVVPVTDLETIKANVGKELTVRGKCSGTYKSRTGSVILINFEGVNRDFVGAIEKDSIEPVNAGFNGDVTQEVNGKTLTITGPIKLYREKPQIVVTKPEQIKIEADAADDTAAETKPEEKKPEEKKD